MNWKQMTMRTKLRKLMSRIVQHIRCVSRSMTMKKKYYKKTSMVNSWKRQPAGKKLSSAKLFLYLLLGGIMSLSGITPLNWTYWAVCIVILGIDYVNGKIVDSAVKTKMVSTEIDYTTIEGMLCNVCDN
jgi:hypothetical protein